MLTATSFVFSRTWHRKQDYSKCRAYQKLLKITNKLNKKKLKKINIDNKFFIMILKCNSINAHSNPQHLALQIWRLSKVRTGWL